MADKSVVAANVLASSNASNNTRGIAGAAITAGQVLYRYTSNGVNLVAPASASAASPQTIVGVAINSAAIGQPVDYILSDPTFTPGFATNVGETLYLSENAGNVCPYADLGSGDQPVIVYLGIGSATSSLQIIAAGVKK